MGEECMMGFPPQIVGERKIQLGIYGTLEFTREAERDLRDVTGYSVDKALAKVLSAPDLCICFRNFIRNKWGIIICDDSLDWRVVEYRGLPGEQLTRSGCPSATYVDERCLGKDDSDDREEVALTNVCGGAGKPGDEYRLDSLIF